MNKITDALSGSFDGLAQKIDNHTFKFAIGAIVFGSLTLFMALRGGGGIHLGTISMGPTIPIVLGSVLIGLGLYGVGYSMDKHEKIGKMKIFRTAKKIMIAALRVILPLAVLGVSGWLMSHGITDMLFYVGLVSTGAVIPVLANVTFGNCGKARGITPRKSMKMMSLNADGKRKKPSNPKLRVS